MEILKEILNRFKSPVTWLAVVGVIYSCVIQPSFKNALPDWTCIAGYVAILFGVVNNPSDSDKF